jgi:hypothetical protein
VIDAFEHGWEYRPARRRSRAALLRELRSLARRVRIPKQVSIAVIVAEGRD